MSKNAEDESKILVLSNGMMKLDTMRVDKNPISDDMNFRTLHFDLFLTSNPVSSDTLSLVFISI